MFYVTCNQNGKLGIKDLINAAVPYSKPEDFNLKGACINCVNIYNCIQRLNAEEVRIFSKLENMSLDKK